MTWYLYAVIFDYDIGIWCQICPCDSRIIIPFHVASLCRPDMVGVIVPACNVAFSKGSLNSG